MQTSPALYDKMHFTFLVQGFNLSSLSLSLFDVRVWSWLLEHINFDSCLARVADTEQGEW